jgi:hypothetical protein
VIELFPETSVVVLPLSLRLELDVEVVFALLEVLNLVISGLHEFSETHYLTGDRSQLVFKLLDGILMIAQLHILNLEVLTTFFVILDLILSITHHFPQLTNL